MARDAPSDIQRQIACARSVDHYYMYRIYFMTGQKRNQEAEQTEKWNYYHFISYEFNEAHCWRAHRLFFFSFFNTLAIIMMIIMGMRILHM